jgi:hypothetical protein
VTATGATCSSGQASLVRLPSASVVTVRVTASGYRPAEQTVPAGQTTATATLDLANNDFSQQLSGWTVGTTNAYVVDHSEASQPLVPCSTCATRPSGSAGLSASGEVSAAMTSGDPSSDWDLVIDTMNRAGAQTVTRRFRVAPGTTDVTVRYRFQSDEHRHGQLTGTYANDWYEVKVRTIGAGGQVQDVQTVSSLWNQFDSNHATPWFTRRLPVTVPGDTVEVTLTAANAVDNAYLGLLYADVVQEVITQVSELTLNDMHATSSQIEQLAGLGASAHPAYGGNTRIHGTIAVTGRATDFLTSLELQVLENGSVRAVAQLTEDVRPTLLNRAFGTAGVTITVSRLLFELTSAQAALLNQTDDDDALRLRVTGRTAQGITVEHDFAPRIRKYVYYTATPRMCLDLTETWATAPVCHLFFRAVAIAGRGRG